MNNIYFYPTLTAEQIDNCKCEKYQFEYEIDGISRSLSATGKSTLKLEDTQLEAWKITEDGLRIKRTIRIDYPDMLKGEGGIACKNAVLGICIIWYNKKQTQMGYIYPVSEDMAAGAQRICFDHRFPPGLIIGDLILDTVFYIKEPAAEVYENEANLINESGVTLGTLDSVTLNFGSLYMDFPIVDVKDSKSPLWWLELEWEDPTKDLFSEDYVCLYLNTHYSHCPRIGEKIKNMEMLIEIVAMAYTIIFHKIMEGEYLQKTIHGVDLEPNSISDAMYYFYKGCDERLSFDSIESLHKSVRINVEKMLKDEEEEDDSI